VLDLLRDLPRAEGFLFFLAATGAKSFEGASVFRCRGSELQKLADCERIADTSSYAQGVFTSPVLVRINNTPLAAVPLLPQER
jgi:hypothetical protein